MFMATDKEEEEPEIKLGLESDQSDDDDDDMDSQYEWSLGEVQRLLERLQSLEKHVSTCLENQDSFNQLVERLESLEKVVWKTHVIGNTTRPATSASAIKQSQGISTISNSDKSGSTISSNVESDSPAYTKQVLPPQDRSSISERLTERRKRIVRDYILLTTPPSSSPPRRVPDDESDIQLEDDNDSETPEKPELELAEAEADSDSEPEQSSTITRTNADKDKTQLQEKKNPKQKTKDKELANIPRPGKNTKSCTACKYTFSTAWALQRHFLTAHSTKEKTFSCSICDKKFARQDYVWHHQRKTHKVYTKEMNPSPRRPPPPLSSTTAPSAPVGPAPKLPVEGSAAAKTRLYCKICNKKFSSTVRARSHDRAMHQDNDEGEQLAVDPAIESPKSLQIVQSLLDKIRLTCLVCSFASKSNSDYRKHYETEHFTTYLKPFKCKLCKKSGGGGASAADLLYSPEEMTEHLLTSHPNPDVDKRGRAPCPVCPVTISQHCHLGRHMLRIHSIGQPMECDKCDETFTKTYVLRCHQIKEHGGITSEHVLGSKAKG